MPSAKTILFVTDYGIYPEISRALIASEHDVKIEHLMRKAIKVVKNNPPDLLIAEFFHEPQFRDRISNLESILSQIQRNCKKSKTLLLIYPEHKHWLPQLQEMFNIDSSLANDVDVETFLEKVELILK